MTEDNNDIPKEPELTPEEIEEQKIAERKRKQRLYMQIYYQRNKEKMIAKNREYTKNNREKVRECNKRWREKNKERVREYTDRYRKLNLDKYAKVQKNYRKKAGDAHREYIRNYMREYRKTNKETVDRSVAAYWERQRARLRDPNEAIRALRKDGLLIKKLKCPQTEDLCMAAVRQNPKALVYVKEQTDPVVYTAMKKNINAIQWVRDLSTNSVKAFCDLLEGKPSEKDNLFWLINHSKWKDDLSEEAKQYIFSKLNKFILGE